MGRAGRARERLLAASPVIAIVALVGIWQLVCTLSIVPAYLLPSPVSVAGALAEDSALLAGHAATSLAEAAAGLACGIALGFAAALLMERFEVARRAFYPLVVLTQTVPTVAIAPLLVLWFGYGMLPKVVLIVVATFFPITVGLTGGFDAVDSDEVDLMRSMGASWWQVMWHVKLPSALPHFFSGLEISATYAIVGAVIAEWLGGFSGLGVYMTRVRNAYAFDKMFAVIFLISAMSLILIFAVKVIERVSTPWERAGKSPTKNLQQKSQPTRNLWQKSRFVRRASPTNKTRFLPHVGESYKKGESHRSGKATNENEKGA